MSERLKRILLIIGFVLLAAAAAFALWWFFFRQALPTPGGPAQPGAPSAGGTLPSAGPAQPGVPGAPGAPGTLPVSPGTPGAAPTGVGAPAQTSLLRDGVTSDVRPTADNTGARYYNPDDGKFYRVTPDGVSVALSDQSFPSVDSVTWGNKTDQAILTFPDGSKVYEDFRSNKQATLPSHWQDFSFSPDDTQVVAKSVALDPGSRYLIVSNPDGTNPRAIEPLGENDGKTFPAWTPNNQIIAYAEVGDAVGFDRQQVILVGQNHENFRALDVEGRGFLPLWSPDGTRVLYSVWNASTDYRPELWVSGGGATNVNDDRTQLNIQTWADKCVWANADQLYCAVPDTLPTGAGLQRELFTNLPDSFYRIDLRTGAKAFLGKPEGVSGGAVQLVLTTDQQHILFTDAQTGKLYNFVIP